MDRCLVQHGLWAPGAHNSRRSARPCGRAPAVGLAGVRVPGFHATRPSPRRALWSTARCSLRLQGAACSGSPSGAPRASRQHSRRPPSRLRSRYSSSSNPALRVMSRRASPNVMVPVPRSIDTSASASTTAPALARPSRQRPSPRSRDDGGRSKPPRRRSCSSTCGGRLPRCAAGKRGGDEEMLPTGGRV